MSKKKGLGRGLSDLMSDMVILDEEVGPRTGVSVSRDIDGAGGNNGLNSVAINRVEPNPDQPRQFFDKEKLEELTKSIQEKGVLQPILVRPLPQAQDSYLTHYQIIAGERRWQAALNAGLESVPVLVRDMSDQEILEVGVIENVQRADLNPIEEARAYRALMSQFDRTQDDVAQVVGKSRSHVANIIRLLNLPEQAQAYLQEDKISMGHARAIISSEDPAALAEMIVEKKLSVRDAEDWVRRLKSGASLDEKPLEKAPKPADIRKLESDLSDALGLVVDLRHKNPSGELRIKYKTAEQLEKILETLRK